MIIYSDRNGNVLFWLITNMCYQAIGILGTRTIIRQHLSVSSTNIQVDLDPIIIYTSR